MMPKQNLSHIAAVFAGLCCTVFFIVGEAVAQNSQAVNAASKKLEIGAVFSPDYAFRAITSTDGTETAEAIREGRGQPRNCQTRNHGGISSRLSIHR